MARSLGMTLYTLFSRPDPAPAPDWPARPAGRLAWLHAPGPGAARAMAELARRLPAENFRNVLLTCPTSLPDNRAMLQGPPPADNAVAVRAFLDHWQPDVMVMSDGQLRPLLVHMASARGIPLLMLDAGPPRIMEGRRGWWPGLMRSLLTRFAHVVPVDAAAARALRKAGTPASVLQPPGRMEEGSGALPCTEAERAALVRLLRTRPVWLAAGLPMVEEAAVFAAHAAALRTAHRLLLIVVPDTPERADALAPRLEATEGWGVARRAADEEPDEDTQVFLADASELGLWYRLAPITFLGGSLFGEGCLRDPFEPAALGSAILHGPRPGGWSAAFARLTEARAVRPVASTADLADAVADLLSPDRAARLAQGAWAAASAGAEVTDHALALIRALPRPAP